MRFVVLFSAAILIAPSGAGGDISGRVLITRRLTKKIVAPAVYDLRGSAVPTVTFDTGLEAEYGRTLVMLEGGPAQSRPKPPVSMTINQLGSRFDPELIAIPVGSIVEFPNSDPIFHNVFSLSGAKSFDLGYYPKGQSKSVKFDKSGIVQVYCHIHSNMSAAIVVTSSGWFGKPSPDGSFTWIDVPAGHYRLVAWHKVAGYYHTEIDVPEKGTTVVNIKVPVDQEVRP